MTLFAFRGVKSHGWTFYDPINVQSGCIAGYHSEKIGKTEMAQKKPWRPTAPRVVMDFLRQ